MFIQMTIQQGIKGFGERSLTAMIKEFTWFNQGSMPGKSVVQPIDANTLSSGDKRNALDAVNLIPKKRSEDIKGRTWANGSKQKRCLSKDETILSSTASTEGLFTTQVLDAYKRCKSITCNVPGVLISMQKCHQTNKYC